MAWTERSLIWLVVWHRTPRAKRRAKETTHSRPMTSRRSTRSARRARGAGATIPRSRTSIPGMTWAPPTNKRRGEARTRRISSESRACAVIAIGHGRRTHSPKSASCKNGYLNRSLFFGPRDPPTCVPTGAILLWVSSWDMRAKRLGSTSPTKSARTTTGHSLAGRGRSPGLLRSCPSYHELPA